MSAWLEKIWRLPPRAERRSGLLPVSWFHYALRLDRDPDYICYRLCNLLFVAGLIITVAMVVDGYLKTSLLIDPNEFRHDKLRLPITFSRLSASPALAMTILFYFRSRITLDICRDDIPVLAHKALLLNTSRGRWIGRSLFGILVSVACVFAAPIVVVQLALHFDMQNSLVFIVVMQIVFGVGGLAVGAVGLITYGMVLEKSIRCFTAFQGNLIRVAEYINQQEKD